MRVAHTAVVALKKGRYPMNNPGLTMLGLMIIGIAHANRLFRLTAEAVEMSMGVRVLPSYPFHPSKIPKEIMN